MERKCKNCFLPLGANQIECSNCGAQNPVRSEIVQPQPVQPPAPPVRRCKNCYLRLDPGQSQCTNCGTHNPIAGEITPPQPQPTSSAAAIDSYASNPDNYSMKWFKFLIYFSLFAGCVLNFITGFQALTGTQYSGYSADIYEAIPALQSADTFYGLALIVLAVYVLITRFVLAGYHRAGPAMYLFYLVACIMVVFIYSIMLSGIEPTTIKISTGLWSYVEYTYSFSWTQTGGSILANIILLICNAIYFNKRKELFIY